MKKGILVTGANGFLGSELVAFALAQNYIVFAVARNNKKGSRVTSLVSKILEEKNLDPQVYLKNLHNIDFNGSWNCLEEIKIPLAAVYHVAAHMSYSFHKLSSALEVNQKLSVELYQKVSELFSNLKYFIYVSTAYTAGNKPDKIIKEELHLNPHLVNAYQVTKWATEMSLAHFSISQKIPLLIVRPSIIVGEKKTGRYSGKNYGFYMFIRYFLMAKLLRLSRLNLDLPKNNKLNLIAIDDVTKILLNCLKQNFKRGYKVIHATSSNGTKITDVSNALMKSWKFDLNYEASQTVLDRFVASKTKANQEFAQMGEWNFETTNASKLLGHVPKAFTVKEISHLLDYYKESFSDQTKRDLLSLGIKQARNLIKFKK